jgi:hypothetical protein
MSPRAIEGFETEETRPEDFLHLPRKLTHLEGWMFCFSALHHLKVSDKRS